MADALLHSLYRDLGTIRARPSWHILRAVRLRDDRRCVVVAPGRRTDVRAASVAFDAVEQAHGAISHEAVPRVSARHTIDGRPALELDCEAIADGGALTEQLTRGGTKIPYGAGDAFIMGIRRALQAAHRAAPAPWSLGRLSGANLLFDASGRWHLVGFGANFPVEDARGTPDTPLAYFQAPELAIGGAPSPAGDYVALLLYMRSALCHIDAGGALRAVRDATIAARGSVLTEALRWIEQRVIGALPGQRASVEEAVQHAERIRALLGVQLDPEGFRSIAARALRASGDAASDEGVLRVAADASWFAAGAPPVPLRGPSRRILQALVERHAFGAHDALRSVDLVELGWPDERVEYEAGLNRVYVTMTRLRRQLPEGALERYDDGYRLAPDLRVQRAAS